METQRYQGFPLAVPPSQPTPSGEKKMFSNNAPANLSEILDEIIASQPQASLSRSAHQSACIVNLKILSSWMFQGDELVTISREGGATPATLLKLVSNPNLSNTLLEQMADYPDSKVRAAIAEHDGLPGHVFYALSQDESISVRYAVARNLSTPREILEQLREDSNPYVVARAAQSIASHERETRVQASVANLNWRENFKAQNSSGKNKALDKQSMPRHKSYRSAGAY